MTTRPAIKPAPHQRTAGAKRAVGAWVAGAALVAPFIFAVPSASAAVPAFPNNLVVFPDRDFITVEGYQEHIGKTGLIEVTRDGAGVVGSAKSIIHEGDVAFEINHPGGVCWGADTGLNVTPDIQPGDKVTFKILGTDVADDTTVQDTFVTEQQTLASDGVTVTVKGHIAPGVDRTQMEQRIIDPAFKDTEVGRRDIRALPGPLTQDNGYSSMLEFGANDSFTATYVFNETARDAAAIAAAAGGARAMAWEEQDNDANRQGLTIAEFEELGGPGMGGCPNGPSTTGPVAPTNLAAAVQDNGDIKVNWTPATAIPGTPAIEGYRVHAVGQSVVNGERVEIGKRIDGVSAKGTTLSGLKTDETYDVFVVSVSAAGETFPAARAPQPAKDVTPPTVTATPAGGTHSTAQRLSLETSEAGVEIYYSTDGTSVYSGGTLNSDDSVKLYTGPIEVKESSTVIYAALDASGNTSGDVELEFIITNDPVPAASTFSAAPVASRGSATLKWTVPDAGADGLEITGYSVQAYIGGTEAGAPVPVGPENVDGVVTYEYLGLTGDTEYQFAVQAHNTNGAGAWSEKSAVVTVLGEVVANAGADKTVSTVAGAATSIAVNLDGAGSTTEPGTTYEWRQGTANDSPVVGTTLATSVSLPETNATYTFRLTVNSGGVIRTDDVRVTVVTDRVAISSATWRAGDLRIAGTGTLIGATVRIYSGTATARNTNPIAVVQVTGVAPATGTFTARLRTGAAANTNPGYLWVESDAGGTAAPFRVTAR